MIIYDHIWSYIITYDYTIIYDHIIWSYMIIYDHIWSYMIIYDHVWSSMIIYIYIYDHIWSHMIIYDHIFQFVTWLGWIFYFMSYWHILYTYMAMSILHLPSKTWREGIPSRNQRSSHIFNISRNQVFPDFQNLLFKSCRPLRARRASRYALDICKGKPILQLYICG